MFDCDVMVDNPMGYGVTFAISVYCPVGPPVANATIDVAAGGKGRWICPLGPLHGACRVTLRTRMVVGSPTNHQVRAYWLAPKFLSDSVGRHDGAISPAGTVKSI